MSDVWIPGLIHDPGAFADYSHGRNREEIVKVHATAKNGAGNITVGKAGYFQLYVPKVGTAMQFAPVDALCWDSGDFNDDGPGVEFEREAIGTIRPGLSAFEPLTTDQLYWGRYIFQWLIDNRGYIPELYAGPRYQSAGFRGFVNHGDLDPNRSDGITREEWAALVTPMSAASSIEEEESDVFIMRHPANNYVAVVGDTNVDAYRADQFGPIPSNVVTVTVTPDQWKETIEKRGGIA